LEEQFPTPKKSHAMGQIGVRDHANGSLLIPEKLHKKIWSYTVTPVLKP